MKTKGVGNMEEAVDVYYDMEIADICQHFSKSRNTVDKAVAKLVKDYPDAGYKYKNPETRRITIKAEGVEKLSKYFRKKKNEISTLEVELRYENEKLKAILEEKEKTEKQIEQLYKDRLASELEKAHQTFLLENQSKDEKIQMLTEESSSKDLRITQLSEDIASKDQEIKKSQAELSEKKSELDRKSTQLSEKETELAEVSNKKADLESENEVLKEKVSAADQMQQELEDYKKREEEYNSKSFFYRMFHKL